MVDLSFLHGTLLFFLIAFAGVVDCAAGGGGLITIPAYLGAGVPISLLIGTNKFSSATGISFAVIRLSKHFKINKQSILYAVIASLLGAMIGARLSHFLTHFMVIVLLLVLMPLLLLINTKMHYGESHGAGSDKYFLSKFIVISFFVSAYDGFFGPGTGTFLFIGFVLIARLSAREAVMNAKIINFTANLSALAYFLFMGRIAWVYAAIGTPAAILGYLIGAQCVTKMNLKWLRLLVSVVIVALIIKLTIGMV